ncbi:cupin domain-containing protein [Methylosarcina fibrata]|uniref:cupin domain-containing protein n=1 Tax=Methylosarcina fibrata TaxID=105972 RepID=UPI00037BB986|nr:cupin domain-containing protein [Methylosarcina fibrata]
MAEECQNIFTDIPNRLSEEFFDILLKRDHVHIERIISRGHKTPEGQWYDQAWDEWVLLLQGEAVLQYEQPMSMITLTAGDHLLIPAHTRHRVEWTPPDRETFWLAVHLHDS